MSLKVSSQSGSASLRVVGAQYPLVGRLGDLTVTIPYTLWWTKQVYIAVNDMHLLVGPIAGTYHDQSEEDKHTLGAKRERLAYTELFDSRTTYIPENSTRNQAFVQALTVMVINNPQITVKNIHIRYEDSISRPGHPFAAGVTLAGFTAETTDGDWVPKFVEGTSNAVRHKV